MMIKDALKQAKRELRTSGYLINCGLCEDYAQRVIELMGGWSDSLTDNATPFEEDDLPGHYWVEYNGICYDAECSRGVKDWRKLPIFRRYYKKHKGG